MSADGRYLLSYETQMYVKPTPMQLDRDLLVKYFDESHRPPATATTLDEFTTYIVMEKYRLPPDVLEQLKADAIFEAVDGDPFKKVEA